jgi:hypothetical protein
MAQAATWADPDERSNQPAVRQDAVLRRQHRELGRGRLTGELWALGAGLWIACVSIPGT